MLLLLVTTMFTGCWGRAKVGTPDRKPVVVASEAVLVRETPASTTSSIASASRVASQSAPADRARQQELELEANLEIVSKMIRTANLDAALRRIEKTEQENPGNAHLLMKTGYLKAMIFHRQKDSVKRRDAMNQMLKNMETMQKDPMYRTAFTDGQDAIDVVRKSLERGGGRYGP
ncbi:MAG TPA: hypothetical protein PKO06_08310 [Candidatus Ozemobacteraceae bacterium]|nr:hypothetical protein [Candidatus Ozemobacteraceae bacterium]